MFDENFVDRTKLRYAMYLRKSTEDETKQSHSIPSQKRECMDFMGRCGLQKNISMVIEEQASAKYPNCRPKFTQMLKDLEAGKIDGIIAYHPDRLARNMREAGVIIDMLTPGKPKKKGLREEPIIKDLLFSSFSFQNDINNRCMLAFQFTMATQYSEHLQEVVTRGINSHFALGQSSGAHKWGYRRDATGFYVPDGSFKTVQKAWNMFRQGASQVDISKFLIDNDVHYMTKTTSSKSSRKISIGRYNTVSRMLRDPFYYGVLCQAGQEVDLRKVQSNFQPMITEEQWNDVQAKLDSRNRKHAGHRNGKKTTANIFAFEKHGLLWSMW